VVAASVRVRERPKIPSRNRPGCLFISGMLAALLIVGSSWPVLNKELQSRALSTCRQNIKILSEAMLMYLADNDQALPAAKAWCDRLAPYLPATHSFICPRAQNQQCSYAFSAALSGSTAQALGEDTIVLFESDRGWNATGGPALLPEKPRHMGGDEYAFASGSVGHVPRQRVKDAEGNWGWAKETEPGHPVHWEPVVKNTQAER